MDQQAPRRAVRTALRSQAGMTLLEIMIVLAIIALVMGFLLGPRLMKAFGEAKGKTAHSVAKKLAHEAYPQWSMNHKEACPEDLKALTKYMNSDDTKDPWGEEFIMLCGENAGEAIPGGFGILSKGEDRKQGTADDVSSWKDPPSD